ncbi:MAG: hypothetical protein HN600_17040, partial [Bacteroidetes bacterium]|nr:hypothetical protein [Bacteroidota bacterium]
SATLESGSTFIYRYGGSISCSFANRTYSNLILETTSGIWTCNISQSSNLTINGDLTVSENVILNTHAMTGTLASNGNVSISGTFNSNSFDIAGGKTLTINSGGLLEVYPNESVNISGTLINNSGISGLVLKSDATGTAEMIHSGTVAATVERYVPVTSTAIQHYLSSPVSAATISCILDNGFGNYNAYKYNPAASGGINDRWERVFSGDAMNFGVGYTIPYEYTSSIAKTISFSGNLNSSTNTTAVSNTDGHWNLLGNPYSAPLSVSSFLTANSSVIYGAVYYFDDKGSPYNTTDYAIHNRTTSSQTSYTNGIDGQPYIAIGQGFFVESNAGGSTVTFNPAWRTSGQSPVFFTPALDPIQRFYISVTDKNNVYNEILVGFTNEATEGFDNMYDAHKLKGNAFLALYSYIDGLDKEYAIQGRPYVVGRDVVKLGIDANTSGHYQFKLNRKENIPAGLKVYLIDKLTDTKVLLDELTDFDIHLASATYTDRFELVFTYDNLLDIKANIDENLIQIHGSQLILSDQHIGSDIQLIDLFGRIVNTWNNAEQQINFSDYSGCYFVTILSENKVPEIKKVIIP